MNPSNVRDSEPPRAVHPVCQMESNGERFAHRAGFAVGPHRARMRVRAFGPREEDRLQPASARTEHRRGGRLDDAGLLGGDLLDRVSEHRRVVEPHARDHGYGRVHDTRGVPRSPHADLQYGDVDVTLSKEPKRGRGEQLELREALGRTLSAGPQPICRLQRAENSEGELVIARNLTVHFDTLGIALQVRTCVQTRARPLLSQDRLGESGGRSLPVRAGDLDRGEGVLRTSECLGQRANAIERRVDAERKSASERINRPLVVAALGVRAQVEAPSLGQLGELSLDEPEGVGELVGLRAVLLDDLGGRLGEETLVGQLLLKP